MPDSHATVLFADLSGSTTVFEALGNERATELVTKITQWIGKVCEACGGRVVKMLGDGVLAVFPKPAQGMRAAVEMQRRHHKRLEQWPPHARMDMQVGLATGEIVEVDGDCFGDAVNIASRLSDLSGPEQIWATASTVKDLEPFDGVRFRSLGNVPIRGKADTPEIYRVEWMEDTQTRHLTRPGNLAMLQQARAPAPAGGAKVRLAWLDVAREFSAKQMPVHIGRVDEAEFVVADQRVSRLHARLDWQGGHFTLTDLSSYGTWVRMGGAAEVPLRRGDCVLSGAGEIALGASFEDFTVPTLTFEVASS
jgi:class 3 adenylate cyclase